MRPTRTHYEVLGVARDAPPEEIKRQYRRLAKRYHPDVVGAGDAAAAHRAFVRITEAYETLSDPQRRESYDRELRLAEQQHRNGAATPPRSAQAGAGRSSYGGTQAPPRRRRGPDLAQMVFNAQMDVARGRLRDAQAVCQRVLQYDARCANAYSLLGDIYRLQGRTDDAIRMYTMAVQLNPNSKMDLLKLDQLARDSRRRNEGPPARLTPAGRILAGIGWVAVGVLVAVPYFRPGQPAWPGFALLNQWTENLVLAMVLSGILTGLLATATGLIGRLDDEFLFSTVRASKGPLPVGILVALTSVIFFPLALVFYLIVAAMEEGVSRPMLRALGICLLGIVLFALAVPPASMQTLLFGGNVLFPCILLGSFAGAFFREPW